MMFHRPGNRCNIRRRRTAGIVIAGGAVSAKETRAADIAEASAGAAASASETTAANAAATTTAERADAVEI